MIVASRMKWAALTPSRCASCSTSVQRESAKRTVVARIGMAAEPYQHTAFASDYRRGQDCDHEKM